jgi:glutathione S-transferase
VPVLVDGDAVVSDSWAIACHLEDHYRHRPSLFGGEGGRAMARSIRAWTDGVVHPLVARCVVKDIHDVIALAADEPDFRESRERFGATLEAWQEGWYSARAGAARGAEPAALHPGGK